MDLKSLSRIMDGSPVATMVINTQHKVIHWNTAIEALTGIKKEDIIGTGDHWKAFYGSNERVLADLILDHASPEEIEKQYEGRCRKSRLIEGAYEAEGYFLVPPSKTGKWLRFTASPIKDLKGKIVCVVETMEDISERKWAEEALRESESNFRNIFERAPDAVWISDAEGNIQAANEAANRLTGYTLDELTGANVKLFLPEPSLKLAREIQEKLLQNQSWNAPYDQSVIRKDRSEADCKVTTNIIMRNGDTRVFQSIARDITEAKRLFENQHYYLQEITRAQEEERKRISRELHDSTAQNLIALMHQLENMLEDDSKLPLSHAKVLWGFYERIRDILQEVRRFSRDLRPSVLDDLGLLPALEWLTGELKTEYGIETSLIQTGMERRLNPQAELLCFRIVQESLRNVAKHARATEARVEVEFTAKNIVITIQDNGIGFNVPENVGGLLHSGKLGLAGIHERVQLLGGKLTVVSEPGKGARVRVEAPIQ